MLHRSGPAAGGRGAARGRDRGELERGDRVVLLIDSEPRPARSRWSRPSVRAAARRSSPGGRAASLGLAREHRPSAVLLAGDLPRLESVLGQLKKHPDTRHLPVALVGDGAVPSDGLRAGAAAFIDDPVDRAGLEAALGQARADGRGPGAPDRADRRRGRGGRRRSARCWPATRTSISSGSSRQTRSRRCAADRSTSAWSPSAGRARRRVALIREAATDEMLRELPLIAFVPGELDQGGPGAGSTRSPNRR